MDQKAENVFRKDIRNEADVRLLVDTFYENVRGDHLIGPIFDERVKDWNAHLPTMYAFWSRLLLGKEGYVGNPWLKHAQLPVQKAHFTKWLGLFMSTIDALFEGPGAEHAKDSAKSIAHSFQVRMGIDPFIAGS